MPESIAVGASRDVKLQVFTDAEAGPFTLAVDDVYAAYFDPNNPLLKITVPGGQVKSGDVVTITIKVLAQDTQTNGNIEAFEISTIPVDTSLPTTYYEGLVGQ